MVCGSVSVYAVALVVSVVAPMKSGASSTSMRYDVANGRDCHWNSAGSDGYATSCPSAGDTSVTDAFQTRSNCDSANGPMPSNVPSLAATRQYTGPTGRSVGTVAFVLNVSTW